MKNIVVTLCLVISGWTYAHDTILRTQNAYMICTTPDTDWVNFCNGLMQGYADYAVISGKACIPSGVTRTELATLFTSKLVKNTEAYKKDKPAVEEVSEIFSLAYPCKIR